MQMEMTENTEREKAIILARTTTMGNIPRGRIRIIHAVLEGPQQRDEAGSEGIEARGPLADEILRYRRKDAQRE